MEKYLKAVSEMYSQFKQREAHPMEKYIGRLAKCNGEKSEVVGYRDDGYSHSIIIDASKLGGYRDGGHSYSLIIDASKLGGWRCELLDPQDVVFKNCESYYYVDINDLID